MSLEYSPFGLLILASLLYYSSAKLADEKCPADLPDTEISIVHKGFCYQFVDVEKKWDDARDYCWKYNGKLLTIENEETQNFIKSSLNSLPWTNNGVWIGLHDKTAEMSFEWATKQKYVGRIMSYSNWARGHPKAWFHQLRDCITMRRNSHWKWHEAYCNSPLHRYRFICQYEVPNPTSPPHVALQNQNLIPKITENVNILKTILPTQEEIKVQEIQTTYSPVETYEDKVFVKQLSEPSKYKKTMNKIQEKDNVLVQIIPTKKSNRYIVESFELPDNEEETFFRKVKVKNYYGEEEPHAQYMKRINLEEETGYSMRNVFVVIMCVTLVLLAVLIVILFVRRLRRTSQPIVVTAEEEYKDEKVIPKRAENEYVVNIYTNPMPKIQKLVVNPENEADDDDDNDGYLSSVNNATYDEVGEPVIEKLNKEDTNPGEVEENIYHFIPEESNIDPIYESLDDFK